MKEQVQETGVRKWFGDDFINMQNELSNAVTALIGKYGPCVLSGCELTVNQGEGTYTLGDGFAYLLDENGENGKICRVYAQTFGWAGPWFLFQASRDKTDVPAYGRTYKDGNTKNIIVEYYGKYDYSQPAHANYLQISEVGVVNTFRDALQSAIYRFVTDTEKSTWNAKANATHEHAQSDVTGLATALSGKANSTHTHAQSDITGLVTALAAKVSTSGLLAAILAIDGSGSGIDADKIDGIHFSSADGLSYSLNGTEWVQLVQITDLSDYQATTDCVSTNTANKVVKRDSSGNFAAGTITVTDIIIA